MEYDTENDDSLTFEPLAVAAARVLVKSVQQRINGATTFAAFDAVWLDAPRHFVGGREPAVSGGDGNKGPASIRAHRQGAAHVQECAGGGTGSLRRVSKQRIANKRGNQSRAGNDVERHEIDIAKNGAGGLKGGHSTASLDLVNTEARSGRSSFAGMPVAFETCSIRSDGTWLFAHRVTVDLSTLNERATSASLRPRFLRSSVSVWHVMRWIVAQLATYVKPKVAQGANDTVAREVYERRYAS